MSSRRPVVAWLRPNHVALCLATAVVAVGLAGCSIGAGAAPAPSVAVADAWVRPAPAGGETAAYLTIANPGAAEDALVGATSPVAGSTMIHGTSTDPSGMTGMSMVDRLPIAAHGTVTLAPGGVHLMLAGLTKAIDAGTTIELELTFEHAGTVVVLATVRPG